MKRFLLINKNIEINDRAVIHGAFLIYVFRFFNFEL